MKIGALWKKESKDGRPFLSGNIEFPGMKIEILVFPKKDKEGRQPDYEVIWSQPRKKIEDKDDMPPPESDDDIPF